MAFLGLPYPPSLHPSCVNPNEVPDMSPFPCMFRCFCTYFELLIFKNKRNKALLNSDVIFPGLFKFPENREFPGIQSNFPGNPGNLVQAAVFLDFRVLFIIFWVQMLILSLFLATLIPNR